ncbi:bifunctional diguanylate cyclase/phosphodiesterase [Actinoplanes sp. NPDC051861]|uniref:putative bifunctional diguanylate cyclase/phosphodiesterase n=1 Tax=Actinoplanes sp. NPDC051861 TaxID=3155170 RepID=UPI00341D29D7
MYRLSEETVVPGWRPRAWAWCVLIGLVVAIVAPLLGDLGRQIAYIAAAGTALLGVAAGIRLHRPSRRWPWWAIAAAMVGSAVANAVWAADLATGRSIALRMSWVDVVYLSQYVLVMAGLFGLTQGRLRTFWSGMTEAGIVLCTGSALVWVLLFDPYVDDRGPWPGATSVIAYPWLDLLVLAAVTRLMVTLRRLSGSDLLLAAAAVVQTCTDVVYFVSVADGGAWAGPPWSATGWVLSLVLIGAAATHPSAGAPARPQDAATGQGWRTVLLNVVLVLIGPAATAYVVGRTRDDFDFLDVAVSLTATALTAVLLVIRSTHSTRLANGRAARLRASLREQAELQRSLSHQARHDALTGLPNRAEMKNLIAEVAGSGGGLLLLLDLDGFKDVNERLGHPTGDALLIAVADRLRGLLATSENGGEVAARLGGDEYALLLPGVTAVERGDLLVGAMRSPVPAGDQVLRVTGSVGVRVIEPGADAVQVLADADLALYAAKAAGKDCAALFEVAMRDEQAERIRLLERLRAAVDAGEFAVHYQPIVSLENGTPTAAEALVRWMPPGRAPVGPDQFIPAAEDSGLIVALGEWVLRQACLDAAAWYRAWGTTLTVNVSPRQLIDPNFTLKVVTALHDSGLPAAALTLEITEGVLVRSGAHAQQALVHLSALRAEGVRVAIDDFGTGYSSLAYLRDLPIDVLKIDRSFMPAGDGDSPQDAQQTALVRTIVDLARSLGLTTVAEGVETAYHADLLRDLGCDRGQGYHFARPIPAPDLAVMFAGSAIVQVGPLSADQQSDAGCGVSV